MNIIEYRYKIGLTYLRSKIFIFTEAYLIDNSGETPQQMVYLQNGTILKKENDCPEWIEKVLSLTSLIQSRKKT